MSRRLALCLTTIVLLQPSASLAQVEVVSRDRVVAMLSAYESFPARDEWIAMGSAAVPLLQQIASAPDQPTFRRARALTALGCYADASAIETLDNAVRTDAQPALRRSALLALATANPSRAFPTLASALEDPDPTWRQTAIAALGTMHTAAATDLLRRRRARESESHLVEIIDRALSAR